MDISNVFILYLQNPIVPCNKHYLNRLIRLLNHYKASEPKYHPGGDTYQDHHIVPNSWLKDLGLGMIKRTKKNQDNFVFLSHKAHFVIHHLYYKAFPSDERLAYAFWRMSHEQDFKLSAHQYKNLKDFAAKKTEAHKRKIGAANRGNKRPDLANINLNRVNPRKGVTNTPEHNRKNSEALKGKKKATKVCPHCLRTIDVGNFSRYHGDRCHQTKTEP